MGGATVSASALPPLVTEPSPAFTRPHLPSPPLTPTPEARSERTVAQSQLPNDSATAKSRKWDLRIKELSCHVSLAIAGWADASSGPLIPYIQSHYHISYTVVSMLFVGQMVGFLFAGVACNYLATRLGLGKLIAAGALIQTIAYAFLVPAFPFPAMPVIYAFGGIGLALQDAQANVFVATLPNAETKLGYLHAAYGLGAAVCPLAATAFASSGILFARFYAISCGLAAINCALLAYAFRLNYVVDTSEPVPVLDAPGVPPVAAENIDGIELVAPSRPRSTAETSVVDKPPVEDVEVGPVQPVELDTRLRQREQKGLRRSVLYQALSNRATSISSIYILLYVGAEVSMGGWIVTFLIENRDGGSDAGYVATGYWFGLMLGRALLNWVNMRVGEKRVIYFYMTTALALEFVIWFRDDLVGNAVVVGLIGMLMGPAYPVAISVLTKVVPRRLHSSSIAFCAALGQTGSAIFPFITGALAQRFSPIVLQPVMIILLGTMQILWAFVPNPARKKE